MQLQVTGIRPNSHTVPVIMQDEKDPAAIIELKGSEAENHAIDSSQKNIQQALARIETVLNKSQHAVLTDQVLSFFMDSINNSE